MATDFTYGGKQILSGGPLKPNGKDMPGDARNRVDCYADIATIPNPYVGLKITVKVDETNNNKMTDYIVKSLKANSIGVANSLIDEVERYVDYLGVSGASGEGLTTEQAQHLQTAYLHSQSTHVQASDIPSLDGYATETFVTSKIAEASLSGGEVDLSGYATKDDLKTKANTSHTHTTSDVTDLNLSNIDAASLNGKKFSGPMTKAEYDAISNKDPNTIYLVDDATDSVVEGIPSYGSAEANKVLAVNSNGTALAWVDAPSGSGSGLTTEQTQQLTAAYNHSQSVHVSSSDIPTKVGQLENDSQYVTTAKLNEAISGIGTGGGSSYDDTELRNSKFDDVTLSNNQLSFKANGNVKKTISLPTTSSDGVGIDDNTVGTTTTYSSEKIEALAYKNGSDPSNLIGVSNNGNFNLFNKNTVTGGRFNISATGVVNGKFFGDTNNKISDFIPICNNVKVVATEVCQFVLLNKNKEYLIAYDYKGSELIINNKEVYYLQVTCKTTSLDTYMLSIDKLPSEYTPYTGEFKYSFTSNLWDFNTVESLITDKKLDKQINGENEINKFYNISSTQIPTSVLGSNLRHFTIFVFDLESIKSKIQDGEPLYFDIELEEKETSLLENAVIWVNYSTSTNGAITAKYSSVNTVLNSGSKTRIKGSMDIKYSSSVNRYLNVVIYCSCPSTNQGTKFNINMFKPKFTLGSIELSSVFVKLIEYSGESASSSVEFYTEKTYARHKDMEEYVNEVKSKIETSTNAQFENVYKVIENGVGGGGSTGSVASKWLGKKVNFFGDSITAQAKEKPLGFINRLQELKMFGAVRVYGTPSSGFVQKDTSDSLAFCVRYTQMADDADLVIIHGGINDWGRFTVVGTKDSVDNTTLYGSLNNFFSGIQNKFPYARKLLVTTIRPGNWKTSVTAEISFLNFVDIIKERASYYGIPILDFTNEGYDSSVEATRNKYTDGGVHPNDEGHGYLADLIGARIELI